MFAKHDIDHNIDIRNIYVAIACHIGSIDPVGLAQHDVDDYVDIRNVNQAVARHVAHKPLGLVAIEEDGVEVQSHTRCRATEDGHCIVNEVGGVGKHRIGTCRNLFVAETPQLKPCLMN